MKTPAELEAQVSDTQKSNARVLRGFDLQKTLNTTVSVDNPSNDTGLDIVKRTLNNKVDLLKNSTSNQLLLLESSTGIDFINNTIPDSCPNPDILEQALILRNSLVINLEETQALLTLLQDTLKVVTKGVTSVEDAVEGINLLKIATTVAVKIAPTTVGAITGLIGDLDDIRTTLTFTSEGNSRIPRLKSSVQSAEYFTSITYNVINSVVSKVELIDSLLSKCNIQVGSIPQTLQNSAAFGDNTLGEEFFNGFKLRVVELKYSQNLTQSIGQALNASGIVLIETEPSFTLNPKTLLQELKLQIVSQNLKAN